MPSQPAISVDSLTKRFGDVHAVDDLSFEVERGEVFGFLGPNGAGKSTTINCLLDFTRPTSGSVSLFGLDAVGDSVAVRERTGSLLEGYGVYPSLTAREHVEHAVAVRDASDDPDELLERVGLLAAADRRAGDFSKGMSQRLAIAVALVDAPDLLILDEPSTGLDPNGARRLQTIVHEEADRGATVFFSSHILEQVEAVADRVGILLDGRLATVGDVDDLRRELGAGTTLRVRVSDVPDGLLVDLRSTPGVTDAVREDGHLEVACEDGRTKLDVLSRVDAAGVYEDFGLREASLGDVFSAYTEAGDA
ncbi:ABC transporter ATP-binding protein [Salinirubellus salinus]|uniref:ABC transporter ATP-binding protein n=1 Tax=Salinirubellus salinus TaxID=1364945 RepID=A0A9E7R475_9EURY|nr:ABC transporter ATP-binding protein [Salinirubellus salinus]UWM55302.1 ABC transporter ATP-binding protein [Salinirubellus salinus]